MTEDELRQQLEEALLEKLRTQGKVTWEDAEEAICAIMDKLITDYQIDVLPQTEEDRMQRRVSIRLTIPSRNIEVIIKHE